MAEVLSGGKVRPRALVVEGDDSVRRLVTAVLARSAIAAETVASVDGLPERLASEEPPVTVLLLDLTLPGDTGEEVVTAIRATKPDLPLILTGDFVEPQTLRRLLDLPRLWFLPKPYAVDELVDLIRFAHVGS